MEKTEVKELILQVLNEQREERRRMALAEPKTEDQKVEKLFLISLGHHLFLPDSKGRAIGTQALYARVKVSEQKPDFYGGTIKVVAYADGRLLVNQLSMYLTGHAVVSMVEVPDQILAMLTPE